MPEEVKQSDSSALAHISIIVGELVPNNMMDFTGIAILILAVIGGSSIGVLANFIPVETPFAKNAWRSGINTIIFIIPAIFEYFRKRNELNYKHLISFKQYMFLLSTLVCQVIWTVGLFYASVNLIQS